MVLGVVKHRQRNIFLLGLVVASVLLVVAVWQLFTRMASAYGSDAFVMVVKTDNSGVSGANQFTIPTRSGWVYNYNIDCNDDGTNDIIGATGPATCTYPSAGTYTIAITGNFTAGPYFDGTTDKLKLIEVKQWGTNAWKTFFRSFSGAANMQLTATDTPDLLQATTIAEMFRGATTMIGNASMNNWNTSTITNMSLLFQDATAFNQPLGGWNTSNVTSMASMFTRAASFNQDLNTWNTGQVKTMNSMFSGATVFNGRVNGWNTGNVTDMGGMFASARAFNQSLNGWNVSNVTTMANMFFDAWAFNQPLNTWSVGNVTTMGGMFRATRAFNQPLGSWNTGKVTNMNAMFYQAQVFNGDVVAWDTSKVTNMSLMFENAKMFNQPVGGWDVGNVTTMATMFLGTPFNQPLNAWNVSKVKDMQRMFFGTTAFNQPLNNWDTSSVTTMWEMFAGARVFDQSLAAWNVSNVTTMSGMFNQVKLSTPNYDATLIGWQSRPVQANVPFSGGKSTYCIATTQRASLMSTSGWTITDAGVGCPAPTITITAPTKLSNANITNTTIRVTEAYGNLTLDASQVTLTGTTAGTSGFSCTQTTATQADCVVTITSSGNLTVRAINSGSGVATRTETGYIVDRIAPNSNVQLDASAGVNNPTITFTASDNIAVARTDIIYNANNGGPGVGAETTLANATSPTALTLDPDEPLHRVVVRTYDTAGNMTEREILFPPIVNFTAPTTIKNSPITDATVTITAPSGNDIDGITLTGATGATLGSCVGAGSDTTAPYAQPVTCTINNVAASGTVTIRARDVGNGAIGQNSQSFIIDTTSPRVTIEAPRHVSNTVITPIRITVTDDTAINASGVSVIAVNSTGNFSISGLSCTQLHPSQVDCTLQVDGNDGTGDIQVFAGDVAGNFSSEVEPGFVIDTTAPTAVAPILAPQSDSGRISDNKTNVARPVVELACTEAPSEIILSIDDGTGNMPSEEQISCSAVGMIEYQLASVLQDGEYTLATKVTDQYGNESALSSSLTLTIDTVPPVATMYLSAQQQPETNQPTGVFTLAFSEPVIDVTESMLALVGGSAAHIASVEKISDTEWRITVQAIADGESVQVTVKDNAVMDIAGNMLRTTEGDVGAGVIVTYRADAVEPPVTIVPTAPNTGLEQLVATWPWWLMLVAVMAGGAISVRQLRSQRL